MSDVKILVLGGTGLISTGIVGQLRKAGSEVVVLSRGRRNAKSVDGVEYLTGERDSYEDLVGTLQAGPFDAVIDMICFRPEQADLAVQAFGGHVGQYIFCSTVDVYSKNARPFPIDESASRDPSPSFAYAYAKAACERRFEAADESGAFPVTMMRPAATYLDRAIAPICTYELYVERLKKGLPIVIHGDGSSLWASTHRDDVARAFVRAVGNPKAYSRAYNLAGTELLTWNEYWVTVANAMGVGGPLLIHIPTDVLASLLPGESEWCVENFQFNNVFDVSAAERDLDFRLTKTWAEGCKGLSFDFDTAPQPEIRASLERLVTAWTGAVAHAETAMHAPSA